MDFLYSARPIGSVEALARAMRINEQQLRNMAAHRHELYDRFKIPKGDGSFRDILNPRRDLKFVQKRINRVVFEHVLFPSYLFGGVKGRDYVGNANAHARAKALISLDVRNFYPSIREAHVQRIFQSFCKFPQDVSKLLAGLTTLDDAVPQGACTSSNLANLVFFDAEPGVVKFLAERGLVYSRLLDDISISSSKRIFGKDEQTKIIKKIAAMLDTRGMHLKNNKTRVVSVENPQDLMTVTGLWLNRGRPRVYRVERLEIRKELHEVLKLFAVSRTSDEYHEKYNRTSGRVAKLTHLGHPEAKDARESLRKMLPHLDHEAHIRLNRAVTALARSDVKKRESWEYVTKYYQLRYKANILRRSNRRSAQRLNSLLDSCRPAISHEEIVYERSIG